MKKQFDQLTVEQSRLSFEQSYEENRRTFIKRLVEAGWTRTKASAEWERIQTEEDESGY